MAHFKITLSYEGTDFVGWQRQAVGVSIQGLLEDALRALDGDAVTVHGAGRTDAGVHALGQVAAFTLTRAVSADVVLRALNARLPDAVRVLAAADAPADFHPRFSARSKTYRYRIWNGEVVSPFEQRYVWHVTSPLDVDAMHAAARLLEGRHDFASFQATGSEVKTTVREVISSRTDNGITTEETEASGTHGSLDQRGPVPSVDLNPFRALRGSALRGCLITYEITGDGFLRHMVRAIVGTLVDVGRGRRRPEAMREVLAARDRAAAGETAPSAGLFLVEIHY